MVLILNQINNTMETLKQNKLNVIIVILITVMTSSNAFAIDSIKEVLSDNSELYDLFVVPFGITSDINRLSADEFLRELEIKEIDCSSVDLGEWGKTINVKPQEMSISNVPIESAIIEIGNNFRTIIYQSAVDDNYKEMSDSLNGCLIKYPVIKKASNMTMYQINDTSGIAISSDAEKKTSMAMLININNVNDFMNQLIDKIP